jgi:UDP-N-acetylmuramoyl-L-alanyl-D-glutamate--2,6-diaminopimelate ligase
MTAATVLNKSGVLAALEPELSTRTVSGLAYDSRLAGPDQLFFAFPGARTDGRRFAADAIARGALAVVSESPRPADYQGSWIQVAHGRKALAAASKNFFGAPDERLFVTAITGTNGKTTTSYLIDSILRSAGFETSLVGTIGYHVGGRPLPAVNTTPESLDLFRLLDESLRHGVTHFIFENSSHAQALGRSYALFIHTAVFTNLTRDHLDFHSTMERYFEAKSMMFRPQGVAAPVAAVVNHDDEWGRRIPFDESTRVYWYGLHADAEYCATRIRNDFSGLQFNVRTPDGEVALESPLVGHINVYNILAAFCCGLSFGIDPALIARGVAQCPAVPGRFERIDEGQDFLVAVDYAHTDDAIRNVIAVARGLRPNRVITLFGCGGDRDRTKRPLMGRAAAEASDFIVLTSDNPRSEDPMRIIDDVLPGIAPYTTPRLIEPDREKAIRAALAQAEPGDIVLLTGKGCETYQVLADRTIDFDDREVARRVLREMGYSPK